MASTAVLSSSSSMMLKQRILAAIRGAFVADAASMGTHWIYDPKVMAQTVDSIDAPEFKTDPKPSFYSSQEFPGHYERGMLSPYGEQLLFVTEAVAAAKSVDGAALSTKMVEWATSFGGRPDHALTTFLENMKRPDGQWPNCGADDDQAHIYMKIVPVTCLYAGQPELVAKVKEAILVHQKNDKALAFGVTAARILEAVLLGAPLQQALDTCLENVAQDPAPHHDAVTAAFQRGKAAAALVSSLDALLLELSHEAMMDSPESPFYNFAARSCALPGAFTGPIYQLYKSAAASSTAPGTASLYLAAIRENILAAGDTCSRSVFVGAVLAAASVHTTNDSSSSSSSSSSSIAAEPAQSLVDQMDAPTVARIDAAARAIAEFADSTKERGVCE